MGTLQRIVFFSLLLSVALTGCPKKGRDQQAQEEPPAAALTIEPLVGIGPVRFGASKEEIVRFFGPPDRQAAETDLNYVASKGLAFEMSPQGGLEKIKCWSDRIPPTPFAVTTFAGATKEGIGMGAARERIVAAYGEPEKTDAKGDIENLSYDKLRTKFTLRQGAVTYILLEAPK
jgi:hypothetical protein